MRKIMRPVLRLSCGSLLLALLSAAHSSTPNTPSAGNAPTKLSALQSLADSAVTLSDFEVVEISPEKPFDSPPEIISFPRPAYPAVLRQSGIAGVVRVQYLITRDGVASQIRILESAHAALEAATIDSVLKARFKPAMRNGQAIEYRIIHPIEFTLRPVHGQVPYPPYTIPAKASAQLPVEQQYDAPPKIRVATTTVYPFDLIKKGVSGSARVAFVVAENGRVEATRVIEASHPDFGASHAAMLESWRFAPALRHGKPVATTLSMKRVFTPSGHDRFMPSDSMNLLRQLREAPSSFFEVEQLDRKPETRRRVKPVYPRALLDQALQETVTLEFLLDSEGRVHLPRIVEAVHPEFGWSAMTALIRWRFEPPMRQGKPVAARLRIPFEFKPSPAKAPGTP